MEYNFKEKTDEELKEIMGAWNGDESGVEEEMAHEAEEELERRKKFNNELDNYYKGINAKGYTRTKEMFFDLMQSQPEE